MFWIVRNLWLVPALPIAAGGVIAVMKQRHRKLAAMLAIGSMAAAFLLSLIAFAHVLSVGHGEPEKQVFNFGWFQLGTEWLRIGWVLDPLTAIMLTMVTFVGLLIFLYSAGYMAEDRNFTRFFCFLALFAGAMLGVVIANSLLLLFVCWELVGLTSYLLIGFWYDRPSAAAAAKKAFLVTRIGDLAFFLGMAWLYGQTGTLLFYDGGIALLIFCGAAGKSGQVPLHVWLPDAMEGPTPVSALIHAATMVAAGVFLMARIYPLLSAVPANLPAVTPTIALQVVTWVGAITAVFGALVAVAQYDIKRILAYSTVSQLGYMMMGLGVGGVPVGMFHLITHAFFKALLFLGAGSVIHGSGGEQDIRRMGRLRKYMPVTFAAYACGMLALCGFPLFSGFWSKDEILHAAFAWSVSRTPFYMGAFGALLTAFYMSRQVCYVFTGASRRVVVDDGHGHTPHESPPVMTIPLVILAASTVLMGLFGTPSWPWFQTFLGGERLAFNLAAFSTGGLVPLMAASSLLVFLGLGLGWLLYGRRPILTAISPDPLQRAQPHIFSVLSYAFYIDRLYEATFVRLNAWFARACVWLDEHVWNGAVRAFSAAALGIAWLDNSLDASVVNGAFDTGCETIWVGGRVLSRLQSGGVQRYLRAIGLALVVLVLLLLWSARA
jgi:NADH-quinone oxidoreductase subunit L